MAKIGELLLGCTLSASGKEIRIDCDEHETKERIFDYLEHLIGAQTVDFAQGKKVWPDLDDRPLPSYGQIPWKQLGRDVVDVVYAKRRDYEFDPTYYEGHQMVPQINFNSLARIVDKYRYYGQPPAALIPAATESELAQALVLTRIELEKARAQVEEASAIIDGLLGLEKGSGQRGLEFLERRAASSHPSTVRGSDGQD